MEQLKNCTTCGHRKGGPLGGYGRCGLSGYYCSTERTYPTSCGKNFEGWVPRPPSLFRRLIEAIIKKLS